MTTSSGPTLLLILDGWGYSDNEKHNAISQANTPVWDQLLQQYPHTLIQTSGLKVGLPEGQMGNSEVGHMNLGAGRVVYQSLTRIDKDIVDGDFYKNPTLCQAADAVIATIQRCILLACFLRAAFIATKIRLKRWSIWPSKEDAERFSCTPCLMGAIRLHAAQPPPSKNSRINLQRWLVAR